MSGGNKEERKALLPHSSKSGTKTYTATVRLKANIF